VVSGIWRRRLSIVVRIRREKTMAILEWYLTRIKGMRGDRIEAKVHRGTSHIVIEEKGAEIAIVVIPNAVEDQMIGIETEIEGEEMMTGIIEDDDYFVYSSIIQ